MYTPPHYDQQSSGGYEPAMSSEYGSSGASALGDFTVQEALSRTASGRTQPGHVMMINLIESFNKVVALPDIDVWRRLSKPTVCAMGRLQIQIRTPGVFMKRTTPWTSTYCVMCGKGHLVIYAKEADLLGYAVNLANAKRLDVSCGHLDDKANEGESSYCTITAKWKFGTLSVQLTEDQVDVWRKVFLDAFDGRGGGEPASANRVIAAGGCSSGAHRLANRAYRLGQAAIAEENSSNPSKLADVFSCVDTEATNDTKGDPIDFDASEEEQQQKCSDTSDHIADCTTPVVETTLTNSMIVATTGNQPADGCENDQLDSKMWSDDEPPEGVRMPQAMRRSYYASLPMSFAHRYRSDGALRMVPRGDRRSERQPLMEWLSQVGADDRFRRARTYFETGRFPQSPVVEATAADRH